MNSGKLGVHIAYIAELFDRNLTTKSTINMIYFSCN